MASRSSRSSRSRRSAKTSESRKDPTAKERGATAKAAAKKPAKAASTKRVEYDDEAIAAQVRGRINPVVPRAPKQIAAIVTTPAPTRGRLPAAAAIEPVAPQPPIPTTTAVQPAVAELKPMVPSAPSIDEGRPRGRRATRGVDAALLAGLRPHLVALVHGRLAERSSGRGIATTREDLDGLAHEHLGRWIAARAAAGEVANIALVLHDGRASEDDALLDAAHQTPWWLANGIYPVHVVWTSGLEAACGQLLAGASASALGSDRIAEWSSDPVLESFARVLGGPTLWAGTRHAAERTVFADGGGRVLLGLLESVIGFADADVRPHIVAQGAGALAAAAFVDAWARSGLPPIRTMHWLGPAVRVDEFRARTMQLMGSTVQSFGLFVLGRDLERSDRFAGYGRSFLTFVERALEPDAESGHGSADLLGLEESLRRHGDIARFFGLGNAAAPVATVAIAGAAPGVCDASSHADLADDPATMETIVRRMLERPVGPIEAWRRRDARLAVGQRAALEDELARRGVELASNDERVQMPVVLGATTRLARSEGALVGCSIGIDRYLAQPLRGAVHDARSLAAALDRCGVDMRPPLLDGEATRDGILAAIKGLLRSTAPGDAAVVAFAGYGARVRAIDPSFADPDAAVFDDALVPFDYEAGAFVTWRDLAEAFSVAPIGVSITCLIDASFASPVRRFGASFGDDADVVALVDGALERRRTLRASEILQTRHVAFRQRLAAEGALAGGVPDDPRRPVVVFTAARDHEAAWESRGGGDFTRMATRLLARSGAGSGGNGVRGWTNASFAQALAASFGTAARQQPMLVADELLREERLFGSVSTETSAAPLALAADRAAARRSVLATAERVAIASSLEAVARALR
jgi:hypothetical protein